MSSLVDIVYAVDSVIAIVGQGILKERRNFHSAFGVYYS